MNKRTFTPNKNQTAILKALAAGKTTAADIAAFKGVTVKDTGIYNSLRALKEHKLVLEKVTRKGATARGNRSEFRLSAKGSKLVGPPAPPKLVKR